MKIAVLGAGLMGRAAIYDLAKIDEVSQVGVYDIDEQLARDVASQYGNQKTVSGRLDAADEERVATIFKEYDAAISCVTFKYNPGLTQAAIKGHCHLVDLGGNNDVVATQLGMNDQAEQAGVIVVPDCGLAPGMVALLVADAVRKLDKTSSIKIRVGGLPQSPRPPLNYQLLFSTEGLINEYWEPCVILDGGRKKTVKPMSQIETLEFDGVGELEAFYTSGGTSTMPDTYAGQVGFLDYKTIRYRGHCELFRPMLEIGLASRQEIELDGNQVVPRELFKRVLERSLTSSDPDLTLVRVTAEGEVGGKAKRLVYEIVDRQERGSSLTSMMRMTAFPAAIIAWMSASGKITKRGVMPQEKCVDPELFIPQLKKRNIRLTITES